MKTIQLAIVFLVAALSGCVGNGVEFGGVAAPMTPPAEILPCEEARNGALKLAYRARVNVPDEVVLFFVAAQNYQSIQTMLLSFDVTPQGEPVNIRYAGPPHYLKHATRQKLVKAASDALQASRYRWDGPPAYAAGCSFELKYIIDWDRAPDALVD